MEEMKDRIQIATCDILRDYLKKRDVDKMDVFSQPDTEVVEDILKKVFIILYPGYYREKTFRIYRYDNRISLLIDPARPRGGDCDRVSEAHSKGAGISRHGSAGLL